MGLAVLEPIISHVEGFGALLLDGVMNESKGGGVVKDDACW